MAANRPERPLIYRAESGSNPLLTCRSAMRRLERLLSYPTNANNRPTREGQLFVANKAHFDHGFKLLVPVIVSTGLSIPNVV